MTDWEKILVAPDAAIIDVIKTIDESACQIAMVVGEGRRLMGVVTDGDIRRAILRSVPLTDPIAGVMNEQPVVSKGSESRDDLFQLMAENLLKHVPIVDGTGRVIGLETLEQIIHTGRPRDNWVIIMAGGLGTRLRPLTENTPKPLLKVGNKPILETILENFVKQHFRRFYISVNYKADMVKEYFGDGARWNAEIRYLEEKERLGTAGALGLIDSVPDAPVIVMNGDLLTTVNFESLLTFHLEQETDVTIGVREYDFEVPYGVISLEKNRVTRIDEKPLHRFLVNAGIYVFNPSILDMVSESHYLDMPQLIEEAMSRQASVAAFPVREFWLDIGRMDDFTVAEAEFSKNFDGDQI